jgi:hypothetical protein
VGIPHYRVGDAAHQRSSYPTKSPTAHHIEASSYVLSNLYDLLGAILLRYPEMLLSSRTALLLDLRGLRIEDVFGLLAESLDHCGVANIVGGLARRNRHHMQLRVGVVGQIDGGGASQLASLEPSVASRIVVGKMLISSPPFLRR